MKRDKKLKILKAIRDGEKYSKNNRDMMTLQMNGYIETRKENHIVKDAWLTEWGKIWLKSEEKKE